MQVGTLRKRGTQGTVQAVLEIQRALPLDDVGEQIAVEGGLLGQQSCQVEVAFCGDELIEPDHARRDVGPVPRCLQPVCGIRAPVTHRPEDHRASLGTLGLAYSVSMLCGTPSSLAEDRGFEPLRAFTQHAFQACALGPVSYTHLRAHETDSY